MTKKEFIEALHHACPAFMRDLKSFVNFDVASRMRISVPEETRNDLSEKEFFNKWPRASRIMSQELILEVISPDLRDWLPKCWSRWSQGRGSIGVEVLRLARSTNIELDPFFTGLEIVRDAEEDLKKVPDFGEKVVGILPPNVSLVSWLTENKEAKIRFRQCGGEDLFSRVAMVIPIYPDTKRDDINWEVIEYFKKLFYGQSHRPKPDKYEKIIKVFRAGQLLAEKAGKEERAYKSWQEVADSLGLELSTVRYIYDRAHQL